MAFVDQKDLTAYLSEYLNVTVFDDLCPNGLQVSGKKRIGRIVSAVSASAQLFRAAAGDGADAVLVHHGLIWNFERPLYTGSYRERIRLLLENDINLYAYHLPLDAHPKVGNNIQIARRLDLTQLKQFGSYRGQQIGVMGQTTPTGKKKFFEKVSRILKRPPLIFDYGPDRISAVGIISGGAQKEIKQAVSDGLDAFITGEASEHIMHYAEEEGIHFISAGHYATETFGVQALGEHISRKFDIEVRFLDIQNPV